MNRFEPKGIIPALITPLTKEGRINEKVLRKLINHVIDGGVHGIFITGTTGEFYGLSPAARKEIIQISVDETAGRVPVYVGTGAITTRESIELTNIAEENGADAVSLLTPMFISPSQEQLVEHYTTIAHNTGLPVLLYNNVTKTGVNITAEAVTRLAEIDNIVGIKDSSGDFTLTGEYIRRTRGLNFNVLAGRDTLIHACLCYGGAGSISATANVAPKLAADIYDLYQQGDREGSLEAQYRLAPLRLAFQLGTFPTVIKEALELIGIDAGPCMDPVGKMSSNEKEELINILKNIDLI